MEAKALLEKLRPAYVELVLPSDSVVSEWMLFYTIRRLPPMTTRARPSFIRRLSRTLENFVRAYQLINQSSPDCVVCVGSSICLPAFLIARLRGVRCVFIESMARVYSLSKTGRLIESFRLAERIYVQWPELAEGKPRRLYRGAVI